MSFSRNTFTNIFGEINSEFNVYTIEDIASDEKRSIISGPFGSNISSKYFTEHGVPVIRGNNLTEDNTKFIDGGFVFVSEEKAKELNTYADVDDLVFTAAGTIGQVGIIPENSKFDRYVISNKQLRVTLDLNKVNQHYAYYWFSSKLINKYIKQLNTGSTIPLINLSILKGLPIPLPSKDIQDKIANIIINIDKKIETNERINKNLEQLMKCIFEDWFVNFNYSNDISFKSSELGEIPSNWNVKKLRDVLIVLESGKRPKGGISDIGDGIPSIGAENILGLGKFNYSKNKLISHEFFSTLKKGVIQDKDVLLYKDGAQLGRKSLFMKGFPFDICCINEHVFRLQSNDEINQFYLYLWLDQEVMTNEIINLNSNSAQPGINQNDVKSLPILVPELKIISKFNKIISPMMNQIFDNALEINKLTNLRDTLLPKLMSGEIDVSKINCDLELICKLTLFTHKYPNQLCKHKLIHLNLKSLRKSKNTAFKVDFGQFLFYN